MSDKPFPPSAKKLRDARKKGEIPKSAQMVSTAVFAAVLFTTVLVMPLTLRRLRELLDAVDQLLGGGVNDAHWQQIFERSGWLLVATVMPVLAAAILGAIASGWAQTRGLLSLDPLLPKMERLDPVGNLKKIISVKQMLDLAKKLFETVVLAALIFWLAHDAIGALLTNLHAPPAETATAGARLLLTMFGTAALFWVAVSALDYGIQYFTFMRDQRMSFDDLKRENKDAEGDPHVRAHRRALQNEMAQKAAPRSMKGARALIANPTHVGVAIAFDGIDQGLPRVHAKALDAQALAMRTEAERLGIPVFEDVPLARSLYLALEVDQEITPAFYQPVADVLVWVDQLASDTL